MDAPFCLNPAGTCEVTDCAASRSGEHLYEKKESSDYGVLEQQHDHSCILSLVLIHFSPLMQRNGE